ncbi:general transcription factor II-I repeat domain-containing protein 2-like [Watersipora subatra]|uniref:general transcription factor II-I repeat domain-containing protein 2-like n=1 Tax=Watersipora subatra TaxID=2589382 RepID=UPI00355C6282
MSGPKKRKVDRECRVFKKEWTTKYLFTEHRSSVVCLICQETVAVFKEYNISRHFTTKHANYASKLSTKEREATAQKLAANLQAQQNFFHRQTAIQESSTKASFMLSFKLAKASKPLSEGEFVKECMVETASVVCPESKDKFEKISLSRRTVTRRVELIDEDITSNLNKKAESFTLYSLALDESNDVKDTAQLLIFIRGINDTFEITEEFLTMESLKGQTRGEDLYDRVSAVIENMKLPWSKLINVTTDGSPNLTGKNVGLLRRIQNKVKDENPDQDVIFLHCIIHQESLCKSVLQLNHVVNPVVKLVNFIRARGLQHRQFITFLEETDADHQDMLYHSRVRWLSLGKVFQRVWELKEEIGAFLELQGTVDEFPELSNKSWLCDFAFAADVFSHMNELNMKLQGKNQFVQDMYTNVKAFKSKLVLFSRQILNKSFTHFPTLATLKEARAKVKKYGESLDALHREFCRRFSDFEKIDKSLQLVACPLSQDSEAAPEELQLELIDLQSDPVLKEKFNCLKLNDFYASLNEAAFPNLRRTAQKMLALFGSTYVCEQTFSIMNINKASHRSQLTDQHLRSILRIATTKLTPDFDALAKKGDQQHCSH